MTTKFFGFLEYNLAPRRIKCGADRDGCWVFEITGPMGTMKVLALDEAEAELAYKEELENSDEWCEYCHQYKNCQCGYDPDVGLVDVKPTTQDLSQNPKGQSNGNQVEPSSSDSDAGKDE